MIRNMAGSSEESKTKDRFNGSDDLFLYIKQSINRCSKLTKNITFLELFKEYRRGLDIYADLLLEHIPKRSEYQQQNTNFSLSVQEIYQCCFIVNTAFYCSETIPALQDSIKKLIEEKLKNQIDLEDLIAKFNEICNKSIQVLVASLWNKLNKVLDKMIKQPWYKTNSKAAFLLILFLYTTITNS
jgi:hypothetical protein